jgi:hypothetical protein
MQQITETENDKFKLFYTFSKAGEEKSIKEGKP